MNVVFVVDASSEVSSGEINSLRNLMLNTVNTLNITDDMVKYSVVTFGETTKLLATIKQSTNSNFKLEDVKLSSLGGLRNVDKALNLVDKDVFGRRLGFPSKMKNSIVVMLTTGDFNPARSKELKAAIEQLENRNIDSILVDTLKGQFSDQMLDDLVNVSTSDIKLLPSLLAKISSQLARIGRKYL